MGTPYFAVPILKSLYQNGYPVSAVYTQPPKKSNRGQKINKSPVQSLSETLNIELRNPISLKNNDEEKNFIKKLNADLAIVVAYGQLIPKDFLDLTKKGFINIHASLLPKWRGAAPLQRSIMNQEKETGISIMKIVEELDGYQKQLSAPYLQDKNFDEKILKEAYERMQYDINASHILFEVNPEASAKDTLIVYNRVLSVRERILNGKISFEDAALKYSADKSSALNKGNLGFFTVFMMVYPFESASYNTPVGNISMPIRTKYGYHIVKVNDKRNAVGEVQVAHIMCKTGKSADNQKINDARKKINRIWNLLNSGKEFSLVAEEYSEDRSTAVKGGILPKFGVGKMVKEFEDMAFSLDKIGDYSEPFETDYGFHIISLVDKKEIPLFDEVKLEIKRKVQSDSRSKLSKDALIKRLKKEYILEAS